jgi:hypothetical protein
MSILIDELLKDECNPTLTQIDSKFYVAKPIPFYSIYTFIDRIKDGFRVMVGKSFAVHYKEDEQLKQK